MAVKHLNTDELNAGLGEIRQSPTDSGSLQMISRRPEIEERELVQEGQLDVNEGLVGDNWKTRGSKQDPPRDANPDTQLTLMNSRVADLVAGSQERWPLAGDQLFVDLFLGLDNLPAGTRLSVGSAVIEVSSVPHTGCKKFVERFGMDAMTFVNTEEGKQMCLRGINTRIVERAVRSAWAIPSARSEGALRVIVWCSADRRCSG